MEQSQDTGNRGRVWILGLESSCDETAAAVVEDGRRILSNRISSQVEIHARYGGVVPEIASRCHLELINTLVEQALQEAGLTLDRLSAIAVSHGPGLVGALLVGVATAKALSYAIRRPLIAVNHLEAHFYSNLLSDSDIRFPAVGLLASGGHTALAYIPRPGEILQLGQTRDDAAGEAFDKVARVMGLGYPGGPEIDARAAEGDPAAIDFPRAYLEEESRFDFSFSGLKSAVINYIHNLRQRGGEENLPDLAASFQAAVVEVLVEKTIGAVREKGAATVLMGGGVVANSALRREMRRRLGEECPGVELHYPPARLCTDNAAMVAAAAYPQFLASNFAPLTLNAIPYLQLWAKP
ncbi:MAG: tRNA (adenosine(37)-N6)-threonylcarbamoyltransferase complex transferase subunit TsaD [Firmicutes bacterium]|nr:tRNA (adenosine(37)-N6)-threonylcarbamoyltransferase complex transferase subunit TsaD [Bacillota bacterium]